jgi:uncharacterized delta-60 repeat protein
MKFKRNLSNTSVLVILLCISSCLVHAQAGVNDSTFNPSDSGKNKDPRGVIGAVYSSVSLPKGKTMIGGNFIAYNGKSINGIARLNADGSIDESFHSGLATGDVVNFIVLQPNNQLIIGGTFKKYGSTKTNQLARINANGSLDAAFNTKVGTNGSIKKAVVGSSGKVIVIGNFTQYNGVNKNNIVRLNTNGQLDPTFNYTDTTPHEPTNLALQTDGKAVVTFRDNAGHDNLIVRLNTNGSVDPSFTVESRAGSFNSITLNAIAIQANGKIVVGGSIFSGIETLNSFCERVNTDGSTDVTFHPPVSGNRINHISIQSNGKIIISGYFKNNYLEKPYSTNTLDRFNTDGSNDATFKNYSSIEGVGFNNNTTSIQADGKIILGGSFKHPQSGITRLNSDGGVDINFNKITGANGRIKALVIQSNGKMLIGGSFSSYNGTACNRFTRINASGSIDTKFNNKINMVASFVNCIAIQSNQKIILGGAFTLNNGTQFNNIARLNANGTEDATFNTGNVVLGKIFSINIQTDGKILISGSLDSYNGTPVKGIIRLNQDGTMDPTFVLDNSVESNHVVSKLQSDGKILIGNYDELHRLNTDGSLDPSFHVTTWFEFIEVINVQNDGKIIVGGNNPVWNDRGFIIRLEADGSTDDAFAESRNLIRFASMTSLANNKIIVGRGESVYRLNANGTNDPTAELESTGSNAVVWCSAEDADGKVILAGDFTGYGGVHRNGIARVLEPESVFRNFESAPLTINEPDNFSLVAYPNPATSNLTIDNLEIGSTVIILNTLGQVVDRRVMADHKTTIETSTYENGVYFIHAEYAGKIKNAKFIVSK